MATPSFPSFKVTGPVHHFITGPANAAGNVTYYLGTAEVQPVVNWQPQMLPFHNDAWSRSIPAQYKDDGEMATVAVTLNYFSGRALDYLGALSGSAGRQGRFSRGLPIFGRKSFQLWQLFENYLDPTARAQYPDLVIGYYWPQVRWMGLEDAPGNQDQKKHCSWECTALRTPQASTSAVVAGEREFLLYSTNESDFPASVRVPQ